jgi:uncharacterized membrane protein
MSVQMLWFLPVLALMSGLFSMVPTLTRPDLFFAVTVAPEFRKTSEGLRILRRFRIIVWSCTLIAVALQWTSSMPLAALLILAAGYIGALVSSHGRALAYAATPSPVVELDLSMPEEGLPGGAIAALLPLLFLAALGAWVGFRWDGLPQKFPVHWSTRGVDRWVPTTPGTVFGFLVVQALVCLLLIGIAWGLLHWSRRISTTGPRAIGERHFRRRIVLLLIVTEYFVPFPAWFAFFQPSATAVNVWGLALTTVVIAFSVALIRGGQGGSRATVAAGAAPMGDRTPDSCWKWGLFYVNPADPSILIEKRFGIGYTVNFGNRWSWVVLTLVLVPLAVALIFLRS